MAGAQPQQPGRALPFLIRMAVYLLFWIVLAGTDMKDMAAGIVTAAVASWLSLSLLPPGELTIRPGRAAGTFLRFLGQSLSAGVSRRPDRPQSRHAPQAWHHGVSHQAFRPAFVARPS